MLPCGFKLPLDLGERIADSVFQVVPLFFRSEGFFRNLQSDRDAIQRTDRILFDEQSQKDNIGRKAFGFFLNSRDQFPDQFLDLFLWAKPLELNVVFHNFYPSECGPRSIRKSLALTSRHLIRNIRMITSWWPSR